MLARGKKAKHYVVAAVKPQASREFKEVRSKEKYVYVQVTLGEDQLTRLKSLVKPAELLTEGQVFLSSKHPDERIPNIQALTEALEENPKQHFYVFVDKLAYAYEKDAKKEPMKDWQKVDYPEAPTTK